MKILSVFPALSTRVKPITIWKNIQTFQLGLYRLQWYSKNASSKRWLNRQRNDRYNSEARVQGLMSRAAFKLIELNEKHHLFNPGMTVVDLGFAPGSWSQVAIQATRPNGRVVGVDILPCRPPRGMSSIQGNFLSKAVQDELKVMLADPNSGKPISGKHAFKDEQNEVDKVEDLAEDNSYVNLERSLTTADKENETQSSVIPHHQTGSSVDIVLSDMCEIWPQTHGFWLRTINDPYVRMMNTSGNALRDHTLSIDLCDAALMFALDTLKPNGKFVCKFYTGSEDRFLENRLRKAFKSVKREKPNATRSESREMYFVATGKLANATRKYVFGLKSI